MMSDRWRKVDATRCLRNAMKWRVTDDVATSSLRSDKLTAPLVSKPHVPSNCEKHLVAKKYPSKTATNGPVQTVDLFYA